MFLRSDGSVPLRLEVRWRYWVAVTDPNDKRKKKACDIWCECEPVQIADGKKDKEQPDNPRCRTLAKAGAVRLRWPEDRDRDVPEEESFTWAILTEDNWNAEAVMGWRWSKAELKRRKEQPQQKRQRGRGRDD